MENNYISFYTPNYVYIPFDTLEKLNLRKNKTVYCGEELGTLNDGNIIYSSISGIIKGAGKVNVENKTMDALVIENDYKDKRFKLNGGKERIDIYKRKEANELLESFNLSGKFNGKKYLVVDLSVTNNNMENIFILSEKNYEILETIDALITIYSLDMAYIVVNNNKCQEYLEMYSGIYPNIKFTGKALTSDKIVNYSGNDILNLYYLLKYNKKVCEKFITVVYGKKQIKIVKTKTNIMIKELIEYLNINYTNITVITYDNQKISNYDGLITDNIKSIIIL